MVFIPGDDKVNNITDRELLKEKIINKQKNTNKKMKNPTFVKFCKFLFYFIGLFSMYILGRKLLEKYGFMTVIKNEDNNKNNQDQDNYKKIDLKELKQQANKND